MANITNTLVANITSTEDTTQNVIVNRTLPNLNFDSLFAQGILYVTLPTGLTNITLPATKIFQFYARNADTTNSIEIHWNGNLIELLNPGEVLIDWKRSGSIVGGITALAFLVAAASANIEYFLGA